MQLNLPNRYPELEDVKYCGSLTSLFEKDDSLRDGQGQIPNFFICGAAKSGTTSLFNYLGQHPHIFVPELKEPGYFSLLRPIQEPSDYLELFDKANGTKRIGEASGAYLTSPDSAHRIANVQPGAKIIIMLRNPAERAFSLYRHMTRHGQEWVSSFQKAVHKEKERYRNRKFILNNPEYYYNFLYSISGIYSVQIKRYIKNFEVDNIKFIIFEDFVEAPSAHTRDVFRFLGLDASVPVETPVHNKGQDIYSPRLQYFLSQKYRKSFLSELPAGLRLVRWMKRANGFFGRVAGSSAKIPRILQGLEDWYVEDIQRTSELTGLDLKSKWL
ncbi:sulfotransferase family protein [Salinibacter ruber]|uniref:sulfotransferase family protein n=1 Tax=Salinibacter ruber TaxID=146919 RepID=UPI0020749BBD|nr:sulfotransferase [Salinibacter ruber]